MQTADFTNVIRTLVYIIAFYYVLRFVARLLFPILVKKAVEHAQENIKQQFGNMQDQYAKPNADSNVDTSKAQRPRESKKVGEYIDYEEID